MRDNQDAQRPSMGGGRGRAGRRWAKPGRIVGPQGTGRAENTGGRDRVLPGGAGQRPHGAGETEARDDGHRSHGAGRNFRREALGEREVFFAAVDFGENFQQGGPDSGGQINLADEGGGAAVAETGEMSGDVGAGETVGQCDFTQRIEHRGEARDPGCLMRQPAGDGEAKFGSELNGSARTTARVSPASSENGRPG